MNELLQIIVGALGSLGFGILFHIRGKRLIAATVGGFIAWGLFLLIGFWLEDEAVRYFIVSLVTSLYCEIMARLLKTPTTTFIMTALVPLIPGSGLYYTMTNAFAGNTDGFLDRGLTTLSLAVALALGVIVVTVAAETVRKIKVNRHS